jgi:hypothetical protein
MTIENKITYRWEFPSNSKEHPWDFHESSSIVIAQLYRVSHPTATAQNNDQNEVSRTAFRPHCNPHTLK